MPKPTYTIIASSEHFLVVKSKGKFYYRNRYSQDWVEISELIASQYIKPKSKSKRGDYNYA